MNNIINKYLDDTSLFHHDLFITIFIYKMNVFVLIPGLFLSPGSRGIIAHLMTISPGYSGIPTQPPVREGTPHPLLLF